MEPITALTLATLLKINVFCSMFIVEIPDCENEIHQCLTDDIYTLPQCKTEFLIDNFGEH